MVRLPQRVSKSRGKGWVFGELQKLTVYDTAQQRWTARQEIAENRAKLKTKSSQGIPSTILPRL
jgi:hypothetical protein